ncbi:MAG: YajQ family cyclic di-GMP-binding protein [Alteromonadaceae bacterium]|uniref:YajQ family cyclic di-GMP-binding protein n=1 Tax=unclassified Marinobacter TaxID=83889 RepID=UPI000C5F0AAE|nr:YajQ family cyclic di-GMP-binding protein [Marinobacter sp. BGYM27]MAA64243.1 YajQ family cyclic di-GMP-binding protein [Alteromonadaceae bacterium]MBH84268.1 YajQ family cyclic di-GMP-binding protein [Alteromonadaceae bacterium]MDG5498540.1 YajQ family cyclic di-GMP-binding protein [Marinobacter sp. BGYM27]|tara:strand:+ start:154 stop:636 length:483 start_codon:yes stop_codon:yes gene_type:complete
MPTFDIVSEIDMHEVTNAVDQAKRDLGNRWDFKNVEADFELDDKGITLSAQEEFQLEQLVDMLRMAFAKRNIDARAIVEDGDSKSGKLVKQHFTLKQGIETDDAKKIVKLIKDQKMKVQASIQGDKVRVTGKKRDDLQAAMAVLRESDLDLPLQFNNFRD